MVRVFSVRTPLSMSLRFWRVRTSSPAADSTTTVAATCATMSPRWSRPAPVIRLPDLMNAVLEVSDDVGIGRVFGEVVKAPLLDFGSFEVTLAEARDAFFVWERLL